MVKKTPAWAGPAAALALVVSAGGLWWRAAAPPEAARPGAAAAPGGRAEGAVPRIDLDRLERAREERSLGRRDLFDFATSPPPAATPPPPLPSAAPPTPAAAPPLPAPPTLNIKYIGTLERRGLRLAMFMTDGKEVLTGQVGQVVASRFVVKRIGIESVDIQELGAEHVRRIPLKGN